MEAALKQAAPEDASAPHRAPEHQNAASHSSNSHPLSAKSSGNPSPASRDSTASPEMPANSPSTTAVVLHQPPQTPPDAEPEPPAPRPGTPPHRRKPPPKPLKGILKPAPPPQAKFSFKRDILAPVSSRLGYAEVSESPLGAVMMGAGATGMGQGVQAAAGWVGSAWKKLGAAAAAEKARMEGQVQAQMQAKGLGPPARSEESAYRVRGASPQLVARAMPVQGSPTLPVRKDTGPMAGPSVPTYLRDAKPDGSVPSSPTPASPTAPSLSVRSLRKVHFPMSELKVVYNISNVQAPSVEASNKEKVETAFQARRRATSTGEARGWTSATLAVLYDECCRTREEGWGLARIRQALKDSAPNPPRALDLTGVQLTMGAAEALGDLLSVDFGLKKLVAEGCGLDDDLLKPILHALLVSGSLPTLSLANNRRLRARGWKSVAIYVKKARKLRYLDLSDNNLDRRAVEYLMLALNGSAIPPDVLTESQRGTSHPAFSSVPPSPASETIHLPRSPSLNSVPLFSPKLKASLKRSPPPSSDVFSLPSGSSSNPRLFADAPLLREEIGATSEGVISLRLENCGLRGQALEVLAHGVRISQLKHISLRRNRISQPGAIALSTMLRDWPTTSGGPFAGAEGETPVEALSPRLMTPPMSRFESANSVTARQSGFPTRSPANGAEPFIPSPPSPKISASMMPNGTASGAGHEGHEEEEEPFGPERRSMIAQSVEKEAKRAAEARQRLRKQIDPLPRVGSLLTLDIKSNEIRGGVAYIAQVLKRNRTLRVLNLSENKIDVGGLVALAEALRYNTTLETLDLSRNPCCGQSLEGISALRTSCTINTTLKRIFLTGTDLSSEGAIALAEFLPEVKTLIHLDLTENHDIDIAGVMALAVAVKMNTSLRCLDLNIPPNDPDFARLSQDILQSCARNTEMAQAEALARGATIPVAAPMLKSAVARELNTRQEQETVRAVRQAQKEEEWCTLLQAAEETHEVLFEVVKEDEGRKTPDGKVVCGDLARELLDQAKANQIQLTETMRGMKIGELKDRATTINEQLSALVTRADVLYSGKSNPYRSPAAGVRSPQSLSPQPDDTPSSPGFSITDGESSDEEGRDTSKTGALKLSMPPRTGSFDGTQGSSPRSPVEQVSRGMTLEEGEVFRKGTALGVGADATDDENETTQNVSGEELKETILEADVARSPRNSLSSPPLSPVRPLDSPSLHASPPQSPPSPPQ